MPACLSRIPTHRPAKPLPITATRRFLLGSCVVACCIENCLSSKYTIVYFEVYECRPGCQALLRPKGAAAEIPREHAGAGRSAAPDRGGAALGRAPQQRG